MTYKNKNIFFRKNAFSNAFLRKLFILDRKNLFVIILKQNNSRDDEIGRRSGLKIHGSSPSMPVQLRLPAPYGSLKDVKELNKSRGGAVVVRWAHNPEVVG